MGAQHVLSLVLTESNVVLVQGRYPDSPKMKNEFCGTKDVSMCQQIQNWSKLFWKKPIILFILSTPEEWRCIRIWMSNFGGIRWREKLETTYPSVISVRESRRDIRDPQDCCNHCRFRNGNGIQMEWTLSPVCLPLVGEMTLFGS